MSERIRYLSVMQKKKLFELVMKDPQLMSGKFSTTFTPKEAKNRWESITRTLNAIPGGCKNWKQWRKCWQDLKAKTKNKQARLVRFAKGTGGPSLQISLTEDESKILESIRSESTRGHVDVSESIPSSDTGMNTDRVPALPNPHDDADNHAAVNTKESEVGTVNCPTCESVVEADKLIGTPKYLKNRLGSTMVAQIMEYSEEYMKIQREKLEINKQKIAIDKTKILVKKQTNLYLKKIIEILEKKRKK